MFDEIVSRVNLGCKILAGQNVVVCRFGIEQARSIVAISQTLDKLVVHESSLGNVSELILDDETSTAREYDEDPLVVNKSIFFISIKDIIKSLSVKTLICRYSEQNIVSQDEPFNSRPNSTKDILLIGCVNSLIVYDAHKRAKLLSVSTRTSVDTISLDAFGSFRTISGNFIDISSSAYSDNFSPELDTGDLIVCSGPNKLYTLRLDWSSVEDTQITAELTSERSISDKINCLCIGTRGRSDNVITGSKERTIRLYQIDSFDQNLRSPHLTIEESSPISCLCPIKTVECSDNDTKSPKSTRDGAKSNNISQSQQKDTDKTSVLPSIVSTAAINLPDTLPQSKSEFMNHFAYGLEDNFIGVYRLYELPSPEQGTGLEISETKTTLYERLWRHKCKQTPDKMIMYDINGDGLDELLIGFKSGRLEARSPFTGQLLAATRCFRVSDRLAALTVIGYQQNNSLRLALVACSTNGNLVFFRSKQHRPRQPLRGYYVAQTTGVSMYQDPLLNTMFNFDSTLLAFRDDEDKKSPHERVKEESTESALHLEFSDTQIEFKENDSRPIKCDSRQNIELLHKINVLECKRMELQKRSAQLFRSKLLPNKLNMTDININHHWDLDVDKAYLNLTVVISTRTEQIRLLRLEDKTRNYITTSHLLINTSTSQVGFTTLKNRKGSVDLSSCSQLVVIPLRSIRDEPCRLRLHLYSGGCLQTGKIRRSNLVLPIYSRIIDVPRYSMFGLIHGHEKTKYDELRGSMMIEDDKNHTMSTRVIYPLRDVEGTIAHLVEWLKKNFLFPQFGLLIQSPRIDNSVDSLIGTDKAIKFNNEGEILTFSNVLEDLGDLITNKSIANGDCDDLEIRLLDVRHTLIRLASETSSSSSHLMVDSAKASSYHLKFSLNDERAKSARSTLKILISGGAISLQADSIDLLVDLVKNLVIGELVDVRCIDQRTAKENIQERSQFEFVISELDRLTESEHQLEESERRIKSELYESSDYTKQLIQQLEIAIELREFATAKELLKESTMMLKSAQNAAKAHHLNHSSRDKLSEKIWLLREKIDFLANESIKLTR